MKKYAMNLGSQPIIKDQSLLNHEAIKQQITILEELKELIPPLQNEELAQLEKNILAEGCREALMIWQTTANIAFPTSTDTSKIYVLIDGHNRYGICQKHKIDFKIHLVSFNSLQEVKEYMIDNQLGRRNLIPEQASYLRGLRYNAEKQEKGKYQREDHKGQNVPYDTELKKEATATRLAKQYNVSEKTIKRDGDFAEGLNKLAPTLKQDILAGKVKIKKTEIQQLAQISDSNASVESLDVIAEIVRTSNQTSEKLVTEKDVLKTKIKATVQKLEKSEDAQLCEELISLAEELKKYLS
ncbi:MAG: hypothetical protein ACOVQ4_05680 [Flectobacillus sp.]|uniref:hypothetical protein n=1 Tax=Flectobacillus sp. TaxID=50419 RepID=UPI003B9B1794